jgi:alpha,alpha-trehalase
MITSAPLLSSATPSPDLAAWRELDTLIASWWDGDLHTAGEDEVRADPDKTLLFLPLPYVTPGGSEKSFPELYGWDTYYVNCALLAHGRADLARDNIRNQLFQIERFGMTLNGNRTWYRTRSQPPLWTEGVRRYHEATGDDDLLMQAYPLLKREYLGYWCADHHATPVGLATNRDIGDTDAPRLHAESETGLDFYAGYGGDVRRCTPLITNCIMVNFADNLAHFARLLHRPAEAERWAAAAAERAALIRKHHWSEAESCFFEYDFVAGRHVPVWSVNAYWPLWAGVASPGQAQAMRDHLPRFRKAHGLAFNDRDYPSPHPEFQWLQWGHPAGWPPAQIMVAEALSRYGHAAAAQGFAADFVALQMRLFQETGKLWEKYNVVEGGTHFPKERYEAPPLHGWSSASVALLGRFGSGPVRGRSGFGSVHFPE